MDRERFPKKFHRKSGGTRYVQTRTADLSSPILPNARIGRIALKELQQSGDMKMSGEDNETTTISDLSNDALAWTQQFTGLQITSNQTSDDLSSTANQSAAGGSTVSAPTSPPDNQKTTQSGPGEGSGSVDTSSADFKQGYSDGKAGTGNQAPPRDGPALADYNAGFAAGVRDAPPKIDTSSADYQQGYSDAMDGGVNNGPPRDGAALADYSAGFDAGIADARAAHDSATESLLHGASHIAQGVVEGVVEIAKEIGHITSPGLAPLPMPEFRELKKELGISDPDDGA
jgi:hypothetical protein